MKLLVCAIAAAAVLPSAALARGYADTLCRADVLRTIRSPMDPTIAMRRGERLQGVAGAQRSARTGATCLSMYRGECWPMQVIERGRRVPALRLINCSIGREQSRDGDDVYLSVVPIRGLNSAADLRRYDLNVRMQQRSVGGAGIDDVLVDALIERPHSPCGRLAQRVLDGDARAAEATQTSPNACVGRE